MFGSRLLVLTCLTLSLILCGCADEYAGREAVYGTITLKGEALKDASIQFSPLTGQDTSGGCSVVNGQFDLAKRDGLKPGKYLVRITSGDGRTPADDEAAGPGGNTNIVSVDRIPPEWSEKSKQEIEVKAGQKNEFKFEIPNTREIKKKR